MKKLLFIAAFIAASFTSIAQVGVGTTTPQSALDIVSTTSGILIPRMTTTQREAIPLPAPVVGLQVYDTDLNSVYTYNGTNWIKSFNAQKAVKFDSYGVSTYARTLGSGRLGNIDLLPIQNLLADPDGNVVELRDMNIYRLNFYSLNNTRVDSGEYIRLHNEITSNEKIEDRWIYGYINKDDTVIYRLRFNDADNGQIRNTTFQVFDNTARTYSNVVDGDPIISAAVYFHRIDAPIVNTYMTVTVSNEAGTGLQAPVAGMMRFNTDTNTFQGYTDKWVNLHD
jgi:hypothetical protein